MRPENGRVRLSLAPLVGLSMGVGEGGESL